MPAFALFGASGQTGGPIARALHDAGLPYRAVARNRTSLEAAFGRDPLAEIATWDPTDPQSVKTAAAGIDTIFYLVGVPYDKFEEHPIIMRRTLEGAITAGVRRIVLIATVYPYGMPRENPVREDHPREPQTVKGKLRKAQEDILLDAQARGDIAATILRLPDFYGPNAERSVVYDIFTAALHDRRANMIGPIDTPHQYVYIPDIGPLALSLAQEPRAFGRTWHFAGSGTITQREFAARVFEKAGRKPKYMVANKTMLRLLGFFNPLMRELVEMQYLQTNPVILDDSALRALLPQTRATTYDDGIAGTLEVMRAAHTP